MYPKTLESDRAESSGHSWRFAGCEFEELSVQLRINGRPVELELKPLEVLQQLLLHAGEVVSKEALLESVWPGLNVVDGSLATAVSKLRKASAMKTLFLPFRVSAIAWQFPCKASTFPLPGRPRPRLSRATLSPGVNIGASRAGWMFLTAARYGWRNIRKLTSSMSSSSPPTMPGSRD